MCDYDHPEIQDIAEYALLMALRKVLVKRNAIVMDVETGAILAMAIWAQGWGYDEDYNYAVGFSSNRINIQAASVMAC
jgi:hypothetical protein